VGIVNDVIVYECDVCNERFLNDLDVFVIDGQIDFSKKSFGILGEKEIVCPKCFLNKMFRETEKMEILNDVLDQYEEDEVEESEESYGDDFFDLSEVIEEDDADGDLDFDDDFENEENE